nr:MAG TPA: hypothetical protein [Caudoviricetes sp.]
MNCHRFSANPAKSRIFPVSLILSVKQHRICETAFTTFSPENQAL